MPEEIRHPRSGERIEAQGMPGCGVLRAVPLRKINLAVAFVQEARRIDVLSAPPGPTTNRPTPPGVSQSGSCVLPRKQKAPLSNPASTAFGRCGICATSMNDVRSTSSECDQSLGTAFFAASRTFGRSAEVAPFPPILNSRVSGPFTTTKCTLPSSSSENA